MFVVIENTDMNVNEVMTWIIRTKKENNDVITPEFAMEVLSKTNFMGHIKPIISNIKKNCSDENGVLVPEKVMPYKDFILSCVDGRVMSDEALKGLQKFAVDCGFSEEFDEINSKQPKVYGKDDCDAVVVNDIEDFKDNLKGKKRIVALICSPNTSFNCYDEDFNKVERLSVIRSNVIDFINIQNLPQKLNFAGSDFVNIMNSDCSKVKEVIIKDDACVKFVDCKGFTGSYDFSQASELNLADSDFSKAQYIKLGRTSFANETIMPVIVDMTGCNNLEAPFNQDFTHTKTCIMKKGASYSIALASILKEKGVDVVYFGDEENDNVGFFGHLFDRGND